MNLKSLNPRKWGLHGMTIVHRETELGEFTHCEYKERIIGPKIGDAVIEVVDAASFEALKRIAEMQAAALADAEFVLEGSTAEEGQSDALLDKRASALERFLGVESEVAKILKEMEEKNE